MTAAELVAQGVRFYRTFDGYRIAGPKDRPDLVETIRAAIQRRIPRVRELVPERPVPFGRCETCAEPLPSYRGGMCELCVAARQKALQLMGVIPS